MGTSCRPCRVLQKLRRLGEMGIPPFEFGHEGARVLLNDPFLDGDAGCGLRWTLTPCNEVSS